MAKKLTRVLILSGCVVFVVLLFAAIAIYRIDASMTDTIKHNSAKRATATVVSVSETLGTRLSSKGINGQSFKVCYILDSFNEVSVDMRQGYQSAEERRLAREGPRCEITSKAKLASRLVKGDKVEVTFLLENDYRIDIASVTSHGEAL